MYEFIQRFPQHIQEAIHRIQSKRLRPLLTSDIHHIVIAGMGSSGIAGTLIQQWVSDKLDIPLAVYHDYTLPAYVNEHTLLIIVSYSGNTQESLAASQIGITKNAHMVAISSGGGLQLQAQSHSYDMLFLPKDLPPRASLGYSMVYILFILKFYKLLEWDFMADLKDAIQLLNDQQATIQHKAEQIAESIQGSLPVIYTTTLYEPVAIRLRQQLNENSKQLCWHHTLPELNHNEVAGWEFLYNNHAHLSIIMLSGLVTDKRLQLQQEISQEILQQHTIPFIIIQGQGQTHLIQSLYLIHLSDWITFYLAQKKGVNPIEIKSINQIKSILQDKKLEL